MKQIYSIRSAWRRTCMSELRTHNEQFYNLFWSSVSTNLASRWQSMTAICLWPGEVVLHMALLGSWTSCPHLQSLCWWFCPTPFGGAHALLIISLCSSPSPSSRTTWWSGYDFAKMAFLQKVVHDGRGTVYSQTFGRFWHSVLDSNNS